jgi:hypothetical protein
MYIEESYSPPTVSMPSSFIAVHLRFDLSSSLSLIWLLSIAKSLIVEYKQHPIKSDLSSVSLSTEISVLPLPSPYIIGPVSKAIWITPI